ncbi:hypothetical protein N9W57_04590 [Pseudomonadales bacterium]|nr:hypothetical protein [Pseudomonadales bacterium]
MKEIASNNLYWEKFSRFVHEKTLRERVIILMVIVVLIYGVIDLLFLGTILDKRERQVNQLNGLLESNIAAQQEVQDLISQIGESRLAMQRQQQMLNDKLDKVDQQLSSAATGFIPATLMPKVLEQLLDIDKSGSEALALIKLENKPVERVTGLDEGDEKDDTRIFSNDSDIAGSSNALTVRPFAIDIDFIVNGIADRQTQGLSATSFAQDLTGLADPNASVFATAGSPFTARVSAVQWQLADDLNNDGQADSQYN